MQHNASQPEATLRCSSNRLEIRQKAHIPQIEAPCDATCQMVTFDPTPSCIPRLGQPCCKMLPSVKTAQHDLFPEHVLVRLLQHHARQGQPMFKMTKEVGGRGPHDNLGLHQNVQQTGSAAKAPVVWGVQVVGVCIGFLLLSAWLCKGCEERAQGSSSKSAKASAKQELHCSWPPGRDYTGALAHQKNHASQQACMSILPIACFQQWKNR